MHISETHMSESELERARRLLTDQLQWRKPGLKSGGDESMANA
jgi:hypothetical protein